MKIKCYICSEELQREEIESPNKDGEQNILCDDYYREKYEQQCGICEEYYKKATSHEESFFVLSKEYEKENGLKKGIYKVLMCPYHGGSILGTDLIFENAVEFVNDYDIEESNEICLEFYLKEKLNKREKV